MNTNKTNRLTNLLNLKKELSFFDNNDIDTAILNYCLNKYGFKNVNYVSASTNNIINILAANNLNFDIENIIELCEFLIEETDKEKNGIVFTPAYISDYIVKKVLEKFPNFTCDMKIIDPGCGCGMFLVSAAREIHKMTGRQYREILEKNLYGIDIDETNVNRCKMILKLLCAENGERFDDLTLNIICADSLKCNWSEVFKLKKFQCIIGNPPYVNPHDMNKETVDFLKNNFTTTKSGVFNIFYAFIENAIQYLCDDGVLGYIVPNNFLTIKSATKLRKFIEKNKLLDTILDFGNNMIFKPVRTYTCIVILTKSQKETFKYAVLDTVKDIKKKLSNLSFDLYDLSKLDEHGWKLVGEVTRRNLEKIEKQNTPIKDFIRTGIATLKDNVYLVDLDEKGYYKLIDNKKYYIEADLVKPIYKIPELKMKEKPEDTKRHIIFPYIKSTNGYILIDETEFLTHYPQTYNLLFLQRELLNSREKGKGITPWYAYGRTQGLNKFGKKLLFPTFSNYPNFSLIDNTDSLFCNGYAVFENDKFNLLLLQKILNSSVMDYYVRNTSYSIKGGYYCYQKKYIQSFSIPNLDNTQISRISELNGNDLNNYLWSLYDLE